MDVTVKSAEWATYKENWHNQLMPVYLLGWYPDYIDPDNYTAAFAGTAGSRGNGIYFSRSSNGMRCLWMSRKPPMRKPGRQSSKRSSRCGPMKFRRPPSFREFVYVFPERHQRHQDFTDASIHVCAYRKDESKLKIMKVSGVRFQPNGIESTNG